MIAYGGEKAIRWIKGIRIYKTTLENKGERIYESRRTR